MNESTALIHHPTSARGWRRWALPVLVVSGLAVLMASIASFRATGVSIRDPESAAVVIRELRFEDRADGSIAVIDHRSAHVIATITGRRVLPVARCVGLPVIGAYAVSAQTIRSSSLGVRTAA